VVLGEKIVSNLNKVRFVVHLKHLWFLDVMDQEFPRSHVYHLLIAPITNVDCQGLALELHTIVNTFGFLPVMLNFEILVWCWTNFLVIFLLLSFM
jgi:hypothetical protein